MLPNFTYDDYETWALIKSGRTNGVFQCESELVQNWLKRILPENIWELSAVVAAVRPGPLKSGYADLYVQYKHNLKEKESLGNALADEITSITHNVVLYQEQLMQMGSRLAWRHLSDKQREIKVDQLRKAVGKKNQAKILEIGKDFIEGCAANQVSPELANKLFEVIKNSGRYAFNLSHSIKYATVAYQTAFLKAHYTKEFYATYLTMAKEKNKEKWEEIDKLAKECRLFNLVVVPPNINAKNRHFHIHGDTIQYGLSHVKFYDSHLDNHIKNLPPIKSLLDFLKLAFTKDFGFKLRATATESFIWSGAFDDLLIPRSTLFSFYELLNKLTDKELGVLAANMTADTKIDAVKDILLTHVTAKAIGKRKEIVKSLVSFLVDKPDNPATIEIKEKAYLGTNLTSCSVDGKVEISTNSCEECHGNFNNYDEKLLAVVIDTVFFTETKKGENPGQKMARIHVRDGTGMVKNIPVFPDLFMAVGGLLRPKNEVLLKVYYKNNGWIAKSMQEI